MRISAGGGVRPPRSGADHKLAVAGLVAGLTLALAGCADSDDASDGGSDDASSSEPTAAESWASDVCSTVGAWTTTIAGAQSTLSNPRDLSANELEATFAEVRTATSTLMDGLDDLGAPDTDAGDEAEERIELLSEDLQTQAEVVDEATGEEPQDVDDRIARVSTVGDALSTMISDTKTAVADVRALDGAQELEDAFASAASCEGISG